MSLRLPVFMLDALRSPAADRAGKGKGRSDRGPWRAVNCAGGSAGGSLVLFVVLLRGSSPQPVKVKTGRRSWGRACRSDRGRCASSSAGAAADRAGIAPGFSMQILANSRRPSPYGLIAPLNFAKICACLLGGLRLRFP